MTCDFIVLLYEKEKYIVTKSDDNTFVLLFLHENSVYFSPQL